MSAFREMLPFGSYPVLKCFLSVNARLFRVLDLGSVFFHPSNRIFFFFALQ